MLMVDPRVDARLLPHGSKPFVYNGPNKEYIDLPTIRTPTGLVITRWELTLKERKAIAEGEDIYLIIVSAGDIHPVRLTVGTEDWSK